MTTSRLGTYALFWVIIWWGTLLGAIAYSNFVFMPVYLSALPASAVVVNGPYGLHEGPFWMIIHPLLILSLALSLALNWKSRPRRKLLAISFATYLVIFILSVVYFVPELGAFRRSPESSVSPAEWLGRARRWEILSWIRGAVMYLAILPLLFALTKSASPTQEIEP